MGYWEFLIQREGDLGWRSIKTGSVQLMEGKYRIVAKSDLPHTAIKTRVTHQPVETTATHRRRAQSRTQNTNSKGLLAIVPYTPLQSGTWQFVCSGEIDGAAWHQILKLQISARNAPTVTTVPPAIQTQQLHNAEPEIANDDREPPTQPLVPISMVGDRDSWADGLDRLLSQIERDSLKSSPQAVANQQLSPGDIQLAALIDVPSQLISLNRATFSGFIPGNPLAIHGTCNLQRLKANLIQTVKIEKISICLRHPQTSEIVAAIDRDLPKDLPAFAFSGSILVPTEPKISLLLGEVNLYDKHNIQIGSSSFSVALNLNPFQDNEISLLKSFDRDRHAELLKRRLESELRIESATIAHGGKCSLGVSSRVAPFQDDEHFDKLSASRSANGTSATARSSPVRNSITELTVPSQPLHPAIPLAYHPEPQLDRLSTSFPPDRSDLPHLFSGEITGDLELDFPSLETDPRGSSQYPRNYKNLEVVVDD